ncbi:hypothetical protein JFL43_13030 [Viridibacillus sp. YIM B01967]|uniref:Uncharacterized protein n=1 Tax=Viridibacillus soli TaxID=2798301 RepID=A0ABS1H9I2_9BACL|nr:hypothetical protein [Viridibacillus soli]MBK3495762.1 hypothetical protein [Viridibacillus soli]
MEMNRLNECANELNEIPSELNESVSSIVGLDRQAANEAFFEFLSEQRLNLQQAKFVEL